MGETLFERIYSLDRAVLSTGKKEYGSHEKRIELVNNKRKTFEEWYGNNDSVRRVIDGECKFIDLHEELKMQNYEKILIPAMQSKPHERQLKLLAEIIPNTNFLRRRGIFFPDNLTSCAAYGFTMDILLGSPNVPIITMLGALTGTTSAFLMRNRSLNSSSDASNPKPWHALQFLDFEIEYMSRKDDLRWEYFDADIHTLRYDFKDMKKSKWFTQARNLAQNPFLKNIGINIAVFNPYTNEREN